MGRELPPVYQAMIELQLNWHTLKNGFPESGEHHDRYDRSRD
jgi:hypothetical protein